MLDDIGFYTLTEHRARNTSAVSPMWRCELLVTSRCNFKCTYCRGFGHFSEDCLGDIPLERALETLTYWIRDGLKNIRFSGGEPTLYPYLNTLVSFCRGCGVECIAVSTNGSQDFAVYEQLLDSGVNDFSISLDACCASLGNKVAGITGKWNQVVQNIKKLSSLTYVTVGCVFTPDTEETLSDVVVFAHSLGVADIRIVSAAQWDKLSVPDIPPAILKQHPILNYRVGHCKTGRNVRGIKESDCHKCHLAQDDSIVAGQWHFPCVIYLREGGQPIGKVNSTMRQERLAWIEQHDSFQDPICRKNCLDICIDYNNAAEKHLKGG